MRKIVFTILAALVATSFWAQRPLCPVKEGVVQTYVMKDAKSKVKNYSIQTVTSVTGSGDNLVVTYSSEALDAKKKPLANMPVIPYSLKVENGTVVVDIKSLLNGVFTGSMKDGSTEGTPLLLPANMKAGDALPDCSVKMQIAVFKVSADYTEGICESEEDVTTEAGTFSCKKTKYNVRSTAMGIKSDITVYSWYAPGVGIVKQELYDKKGKLSTIQELIEMKS